MKNSLYWDPKISQPLHREGSKIISQEKQWQMMGVRGPLPIRGGEGQYFQIDTSAEETLLVYRDPGEKGMRRLFLLAVVGLKKAS